MEASATPLFGGHESFGLVGVAMRATRWGSFSAVWALRSCLTAGGGVEDDLLIGTCIHSGFPWVAPVELLDCVYSIVQVFCGVPNFIVFW